RVELYWLPQICRFSLTSINSALIANVSPCLTRRPVRTARTLRFLPADSGLSVRFFRCCTELKERTDIFGSCERLLMSLSALLPAATAVPLGESGNGMNGRLSIADAIERPESESRRRRFRSARISAEL